jgi:excisionase family DNA binding protein
MVRVREAAEILGVSAPTVYRLVWDGTLPAVKLPSGVLRLERAGVVELAKSWNAPGWISTEDVAERLGVSVRTVERYVEAGDLEGELSRGRLRIRERDVDRLVSRSRVAT